MMIFVGLFGLVWGQSRIVGGEVVTPYAYSWMANINWRYEHYCGGVFLGRRVLLTAAHCSKNAIADYEVEAHRHDIGLLPDEEDAQVLGASRIIIHPKYYKSQSKNDIAVWHLDAEVAGQLEPIELASAGQSLKPGSLVTALGWGWDQAGGSFSDLLMKVNIPVANLQQCQRVWRGLAKEIDVSSQLCAAGQGGKDTCLGDSGGPLLKWVDKTPVLVGITSFGKPCANRNIPSIWTRVSYHLDFIHRNSINSQ
ncbi:hypothetical protein DSO57_1027015 [Entomophthora muscae]|uniref:Uncharacterized protein n=1 Tax=Entomophthora muscae TaxID=34485 RepID=A0ACC2U0C8_9FUNG|nr:hypothetical protein DSO57_1027015 [Entomophthora muscae]